MKRIWTAALAACLLMLPVCAPAQIEMNTLWDEANQLVAFEAKSDLPETPGKQASVDPALMAINMQIEVRFEQEKAAKAAGRAGASVRQEGSLYQDAHIASMGRVWHGEQANGMEGSSAAGLTVNLETGMEIYFDELFDDVNAAVAHMETIIEEEILDSMSDYMEYSDLLPMPQNSFSFNEKGLTVYYPEERYRYFDGEAGSVTFLWHEIADFIGKESPVYALSRPADVNVSAIRSAMALGTFEGFLECGIGLELGKAKLAHLLADPDYTTDALVYPLERMRGFAVEIPKYAETDEDDTLISAVRASNISYHGLTTGKTRVEDLYAIFGEPNKSVVYDEDAAADALLVPGESLFFEELGGTVMQAHLDEEGVLSCLIIRHAMPETLF